MLNSLNYSNNIKSKNQKIKNFQYQSNTYK